MAWAKYSTFDKDGNDVTNVDVENRTAWYGIGNSQEEAFIRLHGKALNAKLNPEKATNRKALDLLYKGRPAELKCQKTPFFVAAKRYDIDPTYAVTFNLKDALAYGPYGKNYKRLSIIYWVDWVSVKMVMNEKDYVARPLTGVWHLSLAKLEKLRTEAPILWYDRRWKVPEYNTETAKKLVRFEPRLLHKGITYSIRGKGGMQHAATFFLLTI